MIWLVEHFFSIQGEGKYCGTPSIFLRFGGCNLKCPGFGTYRVGEEWVSGCDTLRAVDAKRYKPLWEAVEKVERFEAIVAEYMEGLDYLPDIVITGGEPLLYAEDPLMAELLGRLRAKGMRITVETNATIAPDFARFGVFRELVYAMAVKLSNSGEPWHKRVRGDAIRALATESGNVFFKFTLDEALIAADAKAQIDAVLQYATRPVYCMPLGDTVEQLGRNAVAVADFCLKEGYCYSDRLHVRLWNREERR